MRVAGLGVDTQLSTSGQAVVAATDSLLTELPASTGIPASTAVLIARLHIDADLTAQLQTSRALAATARASLLIDANDAAAAAVLRVARRIDAHAVTELLARRARADSAGTGLSASAHGDAVTAVLGVLRQVEALDAAGGSTVGTDTGTTDARQRASTSVPAATAVQAIGRNVDAVAVAVGRPRPAGHRASPEVADLTSSANPIAGAAMRHVGLQVRANAAAERLTGTAGAATNKARSAVTTRHPASAAVVPTRREVDAAPIAQHLIGSAPALPSNTRLGSTRIAAEPAVGCIARRIDTNGSAGCKSVWADERATPRNAGKTGLTWQATPPTVGRIRLGVDTLDSVVSETLDAIASSRTGASVAVLAGLADHSTCTAAGQIAGNGRTDTVADHLAPTAENGAGTRLAQVANGAGRVARTAVTGVRGRVNAGITAPHLSHCAAESWCIDTLLDWRAPLDLADPTTEEHQQSRDQRATCRQPPQHVDQDSAEAPP